MTNKTRIPKQKRSIEKREKIINKGFKLICKKGYYNVSTKDIAKYANVSIGIIYSYFKDKQDIFIEGIKHYSNSIMFPTINILDETKITKNNLNTILNTIIDLFIENHKIEKTAHEQLLAMSHLNPDINDIFKTNELNMANKLVNTFKNNNINISNINEKTHIIIGIIENYSHEVVYHNHKNLNYNIMKEEVIKTIIYILKK